VRQPWLFANSVTSASDISRRIRSSAGCVTRYSALIDNIFAIFAARAGKCSCIAIPFQRSNARSTLAAGFFAGRRGAGLGFRFNICPSSRCALRFGEGPRALGFSMSGRKLNQKSFDCEPTFSHNWRGHSDRLDFAYDFGNDRVTRAHH
jgi:hypothetical protein